MAKLHQTIAQIQQEKELLLQEHALLKKDHLQAQCTLLAKKEEEQRAISQEKVWVKMPDLSNTRCIESRYLQLKEQFQEKSVILDDTRRELFQAQEELLCRQKEYDEEHLFDQPENEQDILRDFLKLGRQLDQIQKHYQQEIDDLNLLIGHLLKQI